MSMGVGSWLAPCWDWPAPSRQVTSSVQDFTACILVRYLSWSAQRSCWSHRQSWQLLCQRITLHCKILPIRSVENEDLLHDKCAASCREARIGDVWILSLGGERGVGSTRKLAIPKRLGVGSF